MDHREEILALEAGAHPVLIRVHDERIVVVDEHRLDGRVEGRVGEVLAHLDDVERAGAGGHQIGPLEAVRCARKRGAGAL